MKYFLDTERGRAIPSVSRKEYTRGKHDEIETG